MSDYWEPWQPELGQRVRVLSRPECHYCREDHDAEVGATGVVYEIHDPEEISDPDLRSHRFWIDFDDQTLPERTRSGTLHSHFAAVELEPIS